MRAAIRRAVILCFTIFLVLPSASAQQRPPAKPKKLNIAVLEFEAREGIPRGEVATLSDVFESHLINTNEFIVVDRTRTKKILEEQGFQQSEACSQVECIVEVGRILKVEKMFTGVVGKVGRVYNITVKVIDISTSQIQMSRSFQHDGSIEDLMQEKIPEIASSITKEMTGKEVTIASTSSSSGSGWMWYVGGVVVVGGVAAALLMGGGGDTGEVGTTPTELPGPPTLPTP